MHIDRVLLKISGEALMGEKPYGLDPAMVDRVADEIKSVHELIDDLLTNFLYNNLYQRKLTMCE